MPHFTLQFTPEVGPMIDIYAAVSDPRAEALGKAGLQAPAPILIRALVDTGASNTCVDPDVLKALGLTPTGVTDVITPSTGAVPHKANVYDVALAIPSARGPYVIPALSVTESSLGHQGFQVLLGRDILRDCVLTYNGSAGLFILAF